MQLQHQQAESLDESSAVVVPDAISGPEILDDIMVEPVGLTGDVQALQASVDRTAEEDSLEEVMCRQAAYLVLAEMLDGLNLRAQDVMAERFGFISSDAGTSLREVGERFGVSYESIRQVEKKSLEKLRGDARIAELRYLTGKCQDDEFVDEPPTAATGSTKRVSTPSVSQWTAELLERQAAGEIVYVTGSLLPTLPNWYVVSDC